MTTASSTRSPAQAVVNPFQSVNDLGAQISYHPRRVTSAGWRQRVAYGALIFGLAMGFFGGYLQLQGDGNALCLILPAVGLLGLGALGLWEAKGSDDKEIALFEQGIAAATKKGIEHMHWDNIEQTYQILTRQGNSNVIRHGYRLVSGNGQTLWWNDDVADAAQAWETARNRVHPRLWSGIAHRVNQGERVQFGAFSAEREGLTHKNTQVRWNEIRDFSINNGILVIQTEQNGKRREIRSAWMEIPNADLLVTLMDRMRG